ncbi:probable arabinosyltransferase ARAD1 [Macadamia integrifolia]|uniref:probable arabinosyltransferase ARAD1 n=1 Tax=Macadamia integrifolia TaxID=60698 RepID=UPI001C4F155A|nr:probable arabinosyltransferase ARAD1 [Macadamia integrifolia]
MVGKALFFLFFLVVLISFFVFTGNLDLRTHFSFSQLPQQQQQLSLCRTRSPLRVFMYDLPSRFNVGMLDRLSSNEIPVNARNLPQWPSNSGLKRQHSVEYWMMASLLYEGEGDAEDTREAIRVLDPENADVFFVPFFSSMSFNTHGINMTDPDTEIDRQLQIDLLEFLRKSKHWQRSGGRDHVIPMQHPNAFRFLRDQVNASIFIIADFGRYPKSMSYLRKDVVAPYGHVVDSFVDDDPPDPFESRTTLLFFRGRTVRKAEGIIRAKLAKILLGYDDVHYERSFATGESIKMSSQGMRLSKFCLNPVGDTPSSCRLFDAIVSHCVPVIVSDRIELPYEDELDYNEFSIFFSFQEALKPGYMVQQLRQIPKERWMKMWERLKNISYHYEFQYPPKKEDAVNMLWRQVSRKLPGLKLAQHRSRRLKIPDWWGRR